MFIRRSIILANNIGSQLIHRIPYNPIISYSLNVLFFVQRSKSYLEQAENLLKYEPKELPEGQMAAQCKQNAIDLDLLLKKLHESIGSAPM